MNEGPMKNRIAPYMEGENNKSIYAWVRRALHDYMSGGPSPSMAVAFAPYNAYFMTQEDTGKQFYNFVEAMEQEEQKEVLDAMKSVLYDLLEAPYKDKLKENPGMRECMRDIFATLHTFRSILSENPMRTNGCLKL